MVVVFHSLASLACVIVEVSKNLLPITNSIVKAMPNDIHKSIIENDESQNVSNISENRELLKYILIHA